MTTQTVSRRQLMMGGAAAGALLFSRLELAFGADELESGEELVPFLDPQPIDADRPMLAWEKLQDWMTPDDQFFAVSHYGTPDVAADTWKLEVEGLVERPKSFSLAEIKARPKRDVVATLECSGNGASPKFMGAIGNARWTGTPLAPLLKECGLKPEAIEFIFWAADTKTEKIREQEIEVNFGRSLATKDALGGEVLLAYAMNGQPLSKSHGAPVRLVVPGWYGIAWVKWLTRIEVRERRFENRFMGRDYVTIRGERRGERTIWRETSVGPMNVKSLVARVVRQKGGTLGVSGAAWSDGSPIESVEVRLDDGPWQPARLDRSHPERYAWTFWKLDLKDVKPGEHKLVSRAKDAKGRLQPAAEDDQIALKKTYWEANEQVVRRIKIG